MTLPCQATQQISHEWEHAFHSYAPLTITYSPREMICQAGSYVAGIHLIKQGVVADFTITDHGEPLDSRILSAGDMIGVEILDSSASRLSVTLCRAITRVELLFIERSQLQRAMDDHPVVRQLLIGHLVDRYISARQDPREKAPLDSRLCRLLQELGQACGVITEDDRIILPSEITPRTLSEMLCISTRRFRAARQAIRSLKWCESGIEFAASEVAARTARRDPELPYGL